MAADAPAGAMTDWFVAADAKAGDGTREKPFHDPWLAFRAAAPGDVIHIAAGTYFGRYDRSSWIIDCPRLTVRGGYSRDFSKRTPWQSPSVFAAFHGYETVRESNIITGRGDHAGIVLDGLFFDSAGRNTYGDEPGEGLRFFPQMDSAIASFNAEDVTIRNCAFTNSTAAGVELAGDGSRFENNLVANIIGISMLNLRSAAGGDKRPITVTGNTFVFAHDTGNPPLGKGADKAIGVRINRPAVVQDNVFVACGNSAIMYVNDPERLLIDGNLFHLTLHDVVNGRQQGKTADITEGNVEEMEDIGFKSAAGNVVHDPGMAGFQPAWLDAVSRYILANYAKPPRDAMNAVRTAAGLPVLTSADVEKPENKGDLAPALAPADALAFTFTAKQGFHAVDLATEFKGQPNPVHAYKPIEWSAIATPDASLANQRVELRCGLGQGQNALLLADAGPETHAGIRIYVPGSDEGSVFVLVKRATLPTRQYEDAIKYNNGREVESTYLLRGVYRTDVEATSRQKGTMVVESIVPFPPLLPKTGLRPAGRDWFVKAGSSGGDGSREKPFRDPFQALDKAEGGDAIHVAGGDYFGKLKSGKWRILIRNLRLLGGYDAEFTNRDPWKNPTRFVLNEEEKAKGVRDGTILGSEENSDGLVLDGFIFDGASYNTYTPGGSMDPGHSPSSAMVDLRGNAPITVRNCLFVNASTAAINISCPSGVFENNVVLNTSGWSMKLRADGAGPWFIRNNSILFASDPTERAGTGKSSADGTLLHLTGRATVAVESNLFAFADNYGVRSTITQQNVSFRNNVFAANLFNHLTDAKYLWIDGSSWQRALVDTDFAAFRDNTTTLPKLPIDSVSADAALARLFALPSRIQTEQWKGFAAAIGSSASPAVDGASASATEAQPAAPAGASLDDLLADLGSIKVQQDTAKKPEPSAPLYCRAFDWNKALALFQDTPSSEPGAHKAKLEVAFSAAKTKPQVDYVAITAQQIDAGAVAFDNRPVEIDVKEARESSATAGYFPEGLAKDNYEAYAIAAVSGPTRTRMAIIVPRDTAASKVLGRTTRTDRLRVRGTARIPKDTGALVVVVDAVEMVQ